jgi:hypothetical protein
MGEVSERVLFGYRALLLPVSWLFCGFGRLIYALFLTGEAKTGN